MRTERRTLQSPNLLLLAMQVMWWWHSPAPSSQGAGAPLRTSCSPHEFCRVQAGWDPLCLHPWSCRSVPVLPWAWHSGSVALRWSWAGQRMLGQRGILQGVVLWLGGGESLWKGQSTKGRVFLEALYCCTGWNKPQLCLCYTLLA